MCGDYWQEIDYYLAHCAFKCNLFSFGKSFAYSEIFVFVPCYSSFLCVVTLMAVKPDTGGVARYRAFGDRRGFLIRSLSRYRSSPT